MNVLSKKLIKLPDLINITDIRTISCNLRDKDDYDMYIIADFYFIIIFTKLFLEHVVNRPMITM